MDFRLVQPVAVDVRKLSRSLSRPSALRPPLASDLLRSGITLKAELLESFEITHLHAIVTRLLPDQKVLEIEGPEGHNILVTSAVDLNSLKLSPGTEISMDILDGLVLTFALPRAKPSVLSARMLRLLEILALCRRALAWRWLRAAPRW